MPVWCNDGIERKSEDMKFTEDIMQYHIAKHFNPRLNLIVPNVSWGMNINYEIDLLIVSQSNYCTEVEIKVSASDIKKDLSKHQAHSASFVKLFYYAVPEKLKDDKNLPEDCGLIIVNEKGRCEVVRAPRLNKKAGKISDIQCSKLQRLCCMRVWSLKEKVYRLSSRREVTKCGG